MSIKKFFLQVGKYLLAVVILFIVLSQFGKTMAIVKIQASYEWLAISLYLGLPLFALIPKSYFRGLLYMMMATVFINFIFPKFGVSYGSSMPFGLGTQMLLDNPNNSESINGVYVGDLGGATSHLIVRGNSWYGENNESETGGLLGNSTGTMNGNRIIDGYGQEIGYIKGGTAFVTIGGERITLQKQ